MTDLTIEDALSMLKSGDASVLAIDRSDERRKINVKHSTEFHNFLIRTLEEHARMVKDAMRYTLEKADEANTSLQRDVSIRTEKLVNTIRWLEKHQPDVFKRGLWEAIDAQITKEQA